MAGKKKKSEHLTLHTIFPTLAGVAQLIAASSHLTKRLQFDFPSGHMPSLRVQSLVRACVGGNQ